MEACQKGCIRKMDDHLVYTTPNHHPPKMDFLPKTFLQIILAAKWLARHPVCPPNSSEDLFLLFCLFLSLYGTSVGDVHTCFSPVVATALWQHEGEEQVEDDVTLVHGIAGNIGHKPVPELSQRPDVNFFTMINDHASHQGHYGRCLIRTRELCPGSQMRDQ